MAFFKALACPKCFTSLDSNERQLGHCSQHPACWPQSERGNKFCRYQKCKRPIPKSKRRSRRFFCSRNCAQQHRRSRREARGWQEAIAAKRIAHDNTGSPAIYQKGGLIHAPKNPAKALAEILSTPPSPNAKK